MRYLTGRNVSYGILEEEKGVKKKIDMTLLQIEGGSLSIEITR